MTVDGVPRPAAVGVDGTASVTLTAPDKFDGHERITIEATLGNLRASETIRVTGGAPAQLTLAVRDARLVADGKQGDGAARAGRRSQRHADRGPGAQLGHARTAACATCACRATANTSPNTSPTGRARRSGRRSRVMASQTLRADATLDVTPPPVRVVAAARAGLFYNLGHAAGPAVFVEAMRPMRVRRVPFLVGVTAGYLRGDVTARRRRPRTTTTARLETDQVPVMALIRAPRAAGGALRAGRGGGRRRVVRADARSPRRPISSSASRRDGTARAPAARCRRARSRWRCDPAAWSSACGIFGSTWDERRKATSSTATAPG